MKKTIVKTNPLVQHHLSVQETVRHMQQHFAKTGAFMSNDLARVLGDPVKGAGLSSVITPQVKKITRHE